MEKIIIAAFGSVPKDGGTFTFYRTIRPKLLEYGIDIRCVSVGKAEASLIENAFVDKGCVILAKNATEVKDQARAFVDWCEDEGVDIVFAINSVAILSALPHLPEKIRVLSRCANAFDFGYKITVFCYERLLRIVTTAPKHGRDLIRDYGVDEERIRMIPNGIAPHLFKKAARLPRGENKVLRLGFLGRLEHNQKGVFYLPEILHALYDKEVVFKCRIAGKGVHGRELEKRLARLVQKGVVEFVGPLSPAEVPDYLGDVDVYLFPSRFEGCPNALLEAIMAGCVPVAWILEGITDFIIKNGKTGFVTGIGDCKAFADNIATLAENRQRLQIMSEAAASDAGKRFAQSRVAEEYARLIKDVMNEPVFPWEPRSWSDFEVDPIFKNPSWHRMVPDPLKKIIKKSLFHLRLTKRYEE